MNLKLIEQIERFLDSSLSAGEMAQFSRAVRADAELRAALVSALRLAGLAKAARDAEEWTAELVRVTSLLIANDDSHNSFERRVMARCENESVARSLHRRVVSRRILFPASLAVAATLVIAVGIYWLQPAAGTVAGLGLRVVEVRESDQCSVIRLRQGYGGQVSDQYPEGRKAVVGMALRQGDRVEVKEGGKATLKYDGEETTVALYSGTATFGAADGAKRVKLGSGLLVCSVAPQAMAFLLETPQAVAEVVGTRFSLEASHERTTLAVQESRVVLRQKDQRLPVNAGESAAADAAGLRNLSPADAWLRELLVRAETGPWDVVNLGTGVYSNDVWRMDARGGAAERRIWNMPIASDLLGMLSIGDGKRWARGVVTGRMMILPEGQAAVEVGGGATATNIGWRTYRSRITHSPAAWQKSRSAGVVFSYGPTERENNSIRELLNADEHRAGVWYRYAVYFDTESPDMVHFIQAAWPEGTAMPPASTWVFRWNANSDNSKMEIGLMVKNVLMVAQGLKFVPLGAEMPLPPKELLDRK